MPVIFEYEPKDTIIHRLNPVTKLVMIVCFFAVISVYWDLRYLVIVALAAAILYIISKTPKKWLLLSIPFATYRFLESMILGITLADPKYYKVIPPELAGKVLLKLGPLTLVYGGFVWSLADIFKIVITMMLTFMFIYTTSLNDLIKSLIVLRVPYKIVYVLVVALRFVPDLWREIRLTSLAQSLRGWKLKTRNPVKLAKMSAPIVNPFTRKLVGYVDTVTLTVQVRGFGAGKIKYPWKLEFKLADWIIIILSIILAGIALYLMMVYGIGLI